MYARLTPYMLMEEPIHTPTATWKLEISHYIIHAIIAIIRRYKEEYYSPATLFCVAQALNPFTEHITII
jgi:hypothetical protein